MNENMRVLLDKLEQSQWIAQQEYASKQKLHLDRLIHHAFTTVPFYKQFYVELSLDLGDMSKKEIISMLPVLTREHIQTAMNDLISEQIPEFHGKCYPLETSGSTGKPVKVLGTDFTRLFYDALMLREHAWHQRDFRKTLLSLKWAKRGFADAPKGHYQPTWGPPINQYKQTGPGILMNVASDTRSQIDALLYYRPYYLMSYPSQLAALAEYCIENHIPLLSIKEVRSTGETLNDTHKHLISTAWPDVKMTDIYSTEEVGNIAQQCPEYHRYHINVESVYFEIVNIKNGPCKIGEPGRVLLTSLMNYATPLIRYEVGDYAEWGLPCQCGRGLPVVNHIHGRKRNRLILPNGESRFPYLGEREDRNAITTAVRKFQFIQHSRYDIEYKVVVSEPLTLAQEEQLITLFQRNLGYPFNIIISYHEAIPNGPRGKYEEFISMVN